MQTVNANTIGNQFGFICPQCGKGDRLSVSFAGTCSLVFNGTEDVGEHDWGTDSSASCGHCLWGGKVVDFKEAEGFEEE